MRGNGHGCPVCAENVVLAHGDIESPILFIGSIPSDDDLRYGRPFSGQVSHIMKRELWKYAHIDLTATRQVLLWWHAKPTAKKQADCFLVSSEQVFKEIPGKKYVILVGADAVKYFAGISVEDCSGMDVTSEIAPEWQDDGVRVFALASPMGLYRTVGEFRFGCEQIAKFMEEK